MIDRQMQTMKESLSFQMLLGPGKCGQWHVGPLSKPSIKVLPDERISPGQNITIECQGPEKGLNFSLYKSGELITSQVTESERNRAEFPFFNVGLEDEGNYTCQYHRRGNPFAWSEPSNATELVVRGQTYPKPSISAVSTNVVSPGGNIILRCASDYRHDAIYYLHKDPPILYSAYWNSEWGAVVFQIANARISDGGTYTCSYCLKPVYQQWCSYRSDPLHPKPSIAVNSDETLAEKGNVKISCKAEDNLLFLFSLYIQVGADRQQRKLTEKTATKEAVFAFDNAQEFQGGLYQCRYCYITDFVEWCSDFSDSRRINRISKVQNTSSYLLPDERISPGQNITIECQGPEKGLNFSLYKSGELITSQVTESERNRAEFPFFNVGLEDEGNYTCQYHRRGNPFAWSEPSNATELVVRGEKIGWVLVFPLPSKSRSLLWRRQELQGKITVLDWPANSPDLNPIENLWGIAKRKMRAIRLSNAEELKAAIEAFWSSITPQQCHRLRASMPRRIEAVIDAKGAQTKH
uniref:Ig-like domain-containing protein n=1 Tax=Podarcis muralis TaxID=64176 RepID=A0A670JVK6_PODMU